MKSSGLGVNIATQSYWVMRGIGSKGNKRKRKGKRGKGKGRSGEEMKMKEKEVKERK
jgi:hypothetical protein